MVMRHRVVGAVCVCAVLLLAVQGCHSNSGGNGNGTSPSPVLSISGLFVLSAIGQTSQLTAILSEKGTSQTLTTGVQWTSADASIATVSAGGLVTVTGPGTVNISAAHDGLTATKIVSIVLVVSAVKVTGNLSFSAIGQTSQLSATATLPDGSTRDVTNVATWRSNDSTIITVSSKGLLTTIGLGAASVSVSYGGGVDPRGETRSVTVTPDGTFIERGWVRHPGHGGVQGFTAQDAQSGRSAVTNSDGVFSLVALTGTVHLSLTRAGFEPAEIVVSGNAGTVVDTETAVQPVIRVTAGQTGQTTIAPKDVEYDVSPTDRCVRCQLMRVVSPAQGTVHLKFTWNRPGVGLTAWIAGQPTPGPAAGPLELDVAVTEGELVVYIGAASGVIAAGDVVTVTLTTTFTLLEETRNTLAPRAAARQP
jgi:hypothetical protein